MAISQTARERWDGWAARSEVKPFFARLEQEGKISPIKVGKKSYYIHSSKKALLEEPDRCAAGDSEEVRLISPMDILVRDQTWLKTFFDYSYTFEYFKKKGMKWPLSILVGNRFVGYFDASCYRQLTIFSIPIILEKEIR